MIQESFNLSQLPSTDEGLVFFVCVWGSVAYQKSAPYVAWKCLNSSCGWVVLPSIKSLPTHVEVELGL